MNVKVGPLSGDDSAAVRLLCSYYGMKPAQLFKYALFMLAKATQMELEKLEASKTANDTNDELREPAAGDSEQP